MKDSQRWGLWALCGSLAAHLLWAAFLPRAPQVVETQAPGAVVEFELVSDIADEASDALRIVEDAPDELMTRNQLARRAPSTKDDTPQPSQESEPLSDVPPASWRTPQTTAEPGDEASPQVATTPSDSTNTRSTAVRLDPRSVALSAFVAASCADGGIADDIAALDSALASQRLNDHLAAATRPPHTARREGPRLHRRSDGRYSYSTPAFTAVVEPDGFVHFHDGPPAELHLSTTFLTFDINDAFERAAGNDPYAAEKRWFLEETMDMRHELAEQARVELMAKASRHLRGQLLIILGDARSLHEKHQAIFALWDDCARDEVGAEGRRIIETFVREEMPQSGPLAFQPAELLAFNSQRYNSEPFQPYGM